MNLQFTWRTNPNYSNYFKIVNGLPVATAKERQIKQILETAFPDKFFEVALNTFGSNFDQWRINNLELTLGGDCVSAQAFGSWLLGNDYSGPATYESTIHETMVCVHAMITYLIEHVSPHELKL